MNFSEKRYSVLRRAVWVIFSKLLIKWARVYRFLNETKAEVRSTKSKNILYAQYYKIIIEHLNIPIIKLADHSDSETTSLSSFPSISFNYIVIKLHFWKLPSLFIAKITTSTSNDTTLQTSVKKLRAFTMCSIFHLHCCYGKSDNRFIGKTMLLGILCVRRKTFICLDLSMDRCPQCTSTCQVRNFPSDEQTMWFLLKSDHGIYILE